MHDEQRPATVAELQAQGALFVEDGNHGEYRPLQHEFSARGTPFIRPDDLKHGRVDFRGCDHINGVALARVRKGKGRPGDIVFTHRATVGRIARILVGDPTFVANPGVTIWRVTDPEVLDRDFLYYYMQTPAFMDQVWAEAGNTDTFPYVSLTQQRRLLLSFPPIERQRSIGQTLARLDDKMKLNREMNQTLEGLARSLFRSWFVDFDPVRAKMEGRPTGLADNIADHFPDRLEESALGPVPKGWRVGSFGSFVEVLSGGTPRRSEPSYWGGDVPWFSVRDAPAEHDVFVVRTDESITQAGVANSAAQVLPTGTTIISARGTVGKLAMVGVPMAMNQSCFGVRGRTWPETFNFYALQNVVEALQQNTHGSVFDTINRATFESVMAVGPPQELTTAFEAVASPLFARIKANCIQSNTLTVLRDTLLPKLLSGEVHVAAENAPRQARVAA